MERHTPNSTGNEPAPIRIIYNGESSDNYKRTNDKSPLRSVDKGSHEKNSKGKTTKSRDPGPSKKRKSPPPSTLRPPPPKTIKPAKRADSKIAKKHQERDHDELPSCSSTDSDSPSGYCSSNKGEGAITSLRRDIEALTGVVQQLVRNQSAPASNPETPNEGNNSGQCPRMSNGLLAGEAVPEKIVNNIREQKFVDFYDILFPDAENAYTISLGDFDDSKKLDFIPRKKRLLSETEWASAFDDFLAVNVKAHPDQLVQLITYSKFIKSIMRKGHDWRYYDHHFRKDREFSLYTWDTVRVDLQLTASLKNSSSTSSTTAKGYNTKSSSTTHSRIPPGFCFNFNLRGVRCQNDRCTYKHKCPRCNHTHPIYLCDRAEGDSKFDNKKHGFSADSRSANPGKL